MKGLIISSGEIKDYKLLKRIIEEHEYIVCADGGVNHILKIGMFPDIVLGDLDSIGKEELNILKKKGIKIEKFSTLKDETDTELCVNHLFKKGIKDITFIGVTGTRLDHTLANIYLLKKVYDLGAKAVILDENNKISYIEDSICIGKKEDLFVSVIPINEDGIVVSLNGFLYPLKKKHLKLGSTMGISNKIIEKYGEIQIYKGSALIIESKD